MAVFLCLLIHASASGCFHRGRAGDSPRCVREDWQAAECWPQLFDLDPENWLQICPPLYAYWPFWRRELGLVLGLVLHLGIWACLLSVVRYSFKL